MLKESVDGEFRQKGENGISVLGDVWGCSWKWHSSWGFDSSWDVFTTKSGVSWGLVDEGWGLSWGCGPSTNTLSLHVAWASSQHGGFKVVGLLWWLSGSTSQSVSLPTGSVTSATFYWLEVSSKIQREGDVWRLLLERVLKNLCLRLFLVIMALVLSD